MENNCCKSCNTVYKQVAVVLDDGAYMPNTHILDGMQVQT